MTQLELIRKLQTLTPNTPYKALLAEEFGVDVPDSAPKHQVEYLYKYSLSLKGQNLTNTQIVTEAAAKASVLFEQFPWIAKKYDKVEKAIEDTEPKKTSTKSDKADGTIIVDEKAKPGWRYQCYYGGKIVAKRKDLTKLKAFVVRKFSVQEFFGY